MKGIAYTFFFIFVSSFVCCQQKNSLTKKNHIKSLNGLWVNSNIDGLTNGKITLKDFFQPCTGFSICYDSQTNKYRIIIQYGEQVGGDNFDSIVIQKKIKKDIIIGYKDKKAMILGCLKADSTITEFTLIDNNVYRHNDSVTNHSFIKLSNCCPKTPYENFIINKVFELFPLKVSFKGKEYNVKNISGDCGGIFKVTGFLNFSSLQFITYNFESAISEKKFEIAMHNSQSNTNNFFYLVIDAGGKAKLIEKTR